jgi:putative chitinase
MNQDLFLASVNRDLFHMKISQKQVSGTQAILQGWETSGYTDDRWLAYMLGTTYWETAKTMQPIEEYGKGKTRPYGSKIKHSGLLYSIPDKIYYGRGLVQLTWYENYELMGRLLNLPLLQQPELALVMDNAIRIMFEGMTKGSSSFGDFTGKCLEMYFNRTTEDWVMARSIINGRRKGESLPDHAEEIANISKTIYHAIKLAA